ncbi:eIF-2-alpha kinase activator GCN1 [Golovinomyces cichoracearum]|uniref:eIF-2-alpha kinase activator GCN1 n=1 Tax=Golovinomyces cichoracearum TaxID=62708 RepID=A0A420J3B1_9PEZI|nr:eIF-2-alpha kinase activator GCN1 [Golovinomyces cichoracearum]
MTDEVVKGFDNTGFNTILLCSSSTKVRLKSLHALEECLSKHGIERDRFSLILQLLFKTYPVYHDRILRRAVERCIRSAFKSAVGPDYLAEFIGLIHSETLKQSIAPSNAYILVEWCSVIIEEIAGGEFWHLWSLSTIEAIDRALQLCLASSGRPCVRHKAFIVTWRCLRKILSIDVQGNLMEEIIKTLCTKPSQPKFSNSVILGAIAGVCARSSKGNKILKSQRFEYYNFYIREIIGSRVYVPKYIATSFNEFFSNFASKEDLESVVIPALERALLRAPEIVLNDLITPLICSLPSTSDLSTIMYSSLLKLLLLNTKSSNPSIRLGALSTFKAAIPRCFDAEKRDLISEEIIATFDSGKSLSAEQRAINAEMLSSVFVSKEKISHNIQKLTIIVGKESNEAALVSETSALLHFLIQAFLSGGDLDNNVAKTFASGICDKRIAIRKTWTVCLGNLYWALTSDITQLSRLDNLTDAILPQLLSTFKDVITNSLAAVQSGLICSAYIFASIAHTKLAHSTSPKIETQLKSLQVVSNVLTMEPKPSFLLNPRVYGKLTNEVDLKWFLKTLISFSKQVTSIDANSHVALAWSQAFIYSICSSIVKFDIRKEAAKELRNLYLNEPNHIFQIMSAGLWRWHAALELGERDSAAMIAKTGNKNLHLIIKSICPHENENCQITENTRLTQMISLLVLCRPEIIPQTNWIDLCIKAKVDPGDLATSHPEVMISRIQEYTSYDEKKLKQVSESVSTASFNAVADLVFVAPKEMTKRVMNLVESDLDPIQLSDIGPLEAAIYHTEEGTACVDVLASKKKASDSNKNIKDYDTLKWEEDVRAQLAKKKGQQQILSSEEKAKVLAQIKKESEIRQKIRHIEARIRRGTGIIYSLVTGPPTDASLWIGHAVKNLLAIISANASLIIGDAASNAYIACSQKLPSRIGAMRPFIGIATLRAMDVPSLTEAVSQEPLSALVTRVLYRLRFSGEQRPFDVISLTYILPLVILVLQNGGYGTKDDAESQLVLSLEFLSLHTGACSDILVPREDILSVLIKSMQKYNQHYKVIKDCLADLCRCIAPNITNTEIAVLLRGITVPHKTVRTAILQSINANIDLSELDYSDEVWLICHDDEEENVELGREIWEESGFKVTDATPLRLLSYLEGTDILLRGAAAKALAEAIKAQPNSFFDILERLKSTYKLLAKPRVPELDEYGLPKKTDLSDPWEFRHGIALTFKELAPLFKDELSDSFLRFLIESGPLGDRSSHVRKQMIEAAILIIASHGKNKVEKLLKTFEQTLEKKDNNSEYEDRVNEAVVIMYGALTRYLNPGDTRVPVVVGRLLDTLNTPSEAVQYAVAECLPPLVRSSSGSTKIYVQFVLDRLFNSEDYASQRGAAYGLAGIVLGRGIYTLREYRIITALKAGVENKKNSNHQEGALLAYELLSTILGSLFEPYVIQIVPQLLTGFGDVSVNVRDSCHAAAKACFARLSSFGVKQILPTLLEGLEDSQWRTKRGACDLLGAMAFLDPQQLAQNLTEIIPPLTCVLNDSHKEVRLAANRSLKRFGEVISNPEIKSIVDVLLKALSDPTKYTNTALDSLIKVSFAHYLDAPSLALVVRILERGLGDRSTTKMKSSQVIGSLAHLTERKDLVSHLPILVAGLKNAIVDPVPTTRATASKALGSLIEKLGEDALPDLIPGLMQTLKTETGAGDRLGSAQALSEVLAGLGISRLDETLPTIIQNASSPKPGIREGFISLFVFLPVCFGNSFTNYLTRIIPLILQGLADDVESIREISLRAGRLLVKNFSARSVELLLPELETGLADDNHRIRLSSTELIGDLLFNLTGVKAEAREEEEEDTFEAGAASASLLAVLGEEKRNKVLSALYICRCDTSGLVRTAAVRIWKALVASPRTLKDMIPTLTKLIVERLGSSLEQKTIAGNALSELVRKAGDGLLSSLLPVLEEGLKTNDANAKQGICIALRELISNASVEALMDHEKILISVVRTALIDADEDVRETAAESFDSLQQLLGKRAVDQVLPFLLNLLRSDDNAGNALSALLTLLTETTRSSIILPNLVPTLTTSPISSFNAKALASLSTVAGSAITRRLPAILNALMENIVCCLDDELREDLNTAFNTVILSVDEFDGLNASMSVLLTLVKHEDHRKRAATGQQLARFFKETTIDYSRYNQDIIRILLILFDDGDTEVCKAAWNALNEFTRRLKKEEMENLVISTRTSIQNIGVVGANLPGFSLPKGVNAILPIFLQGLINGTVEQRTQSALAISDIVDRTNEESLKPFVSQITGPLIRVVSERSIEIRNAVLLTLNNLLAKIPTLLRPFLPQLQRTFAKCLADSSSETLRNRAALALGTLITLIPRVDPLVAELCTGSKTSILGVKVAILKALYEVVRKAGTKMNDTSRTAIMTTIYAGLEDNNLSISIITAKLLGAFLKIIDPEQSKELIKSRVLDADLCVSSVLALNAVLVESPSSMKYDHFSNELISVLCRGMASKNNFILDNCVLASGKYLLSEIRSNDFETLKLIFESLANLIQPGNSADTRRLALVVIRTVCRHHRNIIRPHILLIAIPVFMSARDSIIPVKLAAEAAFVVLFNVVDEESKFFDKFIASPEFPVKHKKVMQDYFKRVTSRLGNTARERREAEGGVNSLGLSNDEVDDEREIWSIGKVELGEASHED